jgi:hypothetical protein
MTPNLEAPLTAAEFASLKETAKGLMKRTIPADHKAKLLKLGFIAEKLGGLVPTDAGKMRIGRGK